jgi:23S rRNA (pseudouridine1915-N3)-methyltransferase
VQIHILAVGSRMPDWVNQAVQEYARRMPPHLRWVVREIPATPRRKGADITRLLREEGEKLLAAVPRDAQVVALERTGKSVDTEDMARAMEAWLRDGRDVALVIGGPEGLAPELLQRADTLWSLSALTLAHPVVRVVLAEQLYRAWSILDHQPYHRGADATGRRG